MGMIKKINLERPFYLNMFKVTHFLLVIHCSCLLVYWLLELTKEIEYERKDHIVN